MKLIDKIWDESAELAKEEMALYKTLRVNQKSLDILIEEYNELFKVDKCTPKTLQKYFGTRVFVDKKLEDGYILER